ncbi:MAG: lipopolysaccharide biosynthesis protein [Acetivibrio ethanolgignens]
MPTKKEAQQGKNRSLKLNIAASMVIQIVSLMTNLISKRAIKYYLGMEYLGIQSVYSNFCDVMSFAFFGMGTAMLFSLYGAFARNDREKLAAFYQYYDGFYKRVSLLVLAVGAISTFAVVFFVNADVEIIEICTTYVTFLLSVVLYNRQLVRSYFIQADQRRYVVAMVTGGVDVTALAAEVFVLRYFHNYELMVICILAKNLVTNVILKKYLEKEYAYIYQSKEELLEKEKKEARENIFSMGLYRFGSVLIHNTDSIFISYFINTAMVGIYSNYMFIMVGIRSLAGALFEAIRGRVGYQIQTSSKEKQYRGFCLYSLVNAWLMGVSLICFYFLVQDFIRLWMGKIEFFSEEIILVLLVNFYLDEAHNAVKMYREAAGLFRNIQNIILLKGILNSILSYIMGRAWGLKGVLIATTVSSVTTLFWYESKIVYDYFKKSFFNEIIYNSITIGLMGISFLLTDLMVSKLSGETAGAFIVKMVICALASNLVYLPIFTACYIKWREQGRNERNVLFEQYPYLCATFRLKKSMKIRRKEVSAESLISPYRLDLMAKLLLLTAKNGTYDRKRADDLYKKHLEAFSNRLMIESGQNEKRGLQKYLDTFEQIASTTREDSNTLVQLGNPIPVDAKYMAMDGAHRISTAIFYEKRLLVYLFDKKLPNKYDFLFFRKRFLAETYIIEMAKKYVDMRKCCLYTLPAGILEDKEFRKIYDEYAPVYMKKLNSGKIIMLLDCQWIKEHGEGSKIEELQKYAVWRIDSGKEIIKYLEDKEAELIWQNWLEKLYYRFGPFFQTGRACVRRGIKIIFRRPV